MKRTYGGLAMLCTAIAVVAAVAAGLGVFARGDGASAVGTSIRGETIEYAASGVYANNAARVVAEGIGWDVVTLLFAVPALLLAVPGIRRASLKARVFALGVLAYFFYQYLMYAMSWALGPLFPVFIVLFALAGWALVWLASTIDVPALAGSVSARFPRRGMIGFCLFVAVLLVGMWSGRIAAGLSGDLEGAGLFGMTTLVVQAMDLGIVVPLALATALLLWRRRPWGYLLAAVFAVKGVTMSGAICAMLVSAAIAEGTLEVVPLALFGGMTLAAAAFAWRVFGGMRSDVTRDGLSASAPALRG